MTSKRVCKNCGSDTTKKFRPDFGEEDDTINLIQAGVDSAATYNDIMFQEVEPLSAKVPRCLHVWINSQNGEEKAKARQELYSVSIDEETDVWELAAILGYGKNKMQSVTNTQTTKYAQIWKLFNDFKRKKNFETKQERVKESLYNERGERLGPLLLAEMWLSKERFASSAAGQEIEKFANEINSADCLTNIGHELGFTDDDIKFYTAKCTTTRNAVWKLYFEYRARRQVMPTEPAVQHV